MSSLIIKAYKVADLVALRNPKNPRWMPEAVQESLQASLTEFGLVEPLVLNLRTRQIVGGHQRLDALVAQGTEVAPVVEIDVDEAAETTLNLSLNKIRGDWDFEKLAILLNDIPDDKLLATGFSEEEASSIVESFYVAEDLTDDDDGTGGDDSGVVKETRNRTAGEVANIVGRAVKVQFGMFTKDVPTDEYLAWVAGLKAESAAGDSPVALGAVVAKRAGIDLAATGSESAELEDVAA
jgi:ParB-like nuclease domain